MTSNTTNAHDLKIRGGGGLRRGFHAAYPKLKNAMFYILACTGSYVHETIVQGIGNIIAMETKQTARDCHMFCRQDARCARWSWTRIHSKSYSPKPPARRSCRLYNKRIPFVTVSRSFNIEDISGDVNACYTRPADCRCAPGTGHGEGSCSPVLYGACYLDGGAEMASCPGAMFSRADGRWRSADPWICRKAKSFDNFRCTGSESSFSQCPKDANVRCTKQLFSLCKEPGENLRLTTCASGTCAPVPRGSHSHVGVLVSNGHNVCAPLTPTPARFRLARIGKLKNHASGTRDNNTKRWFVYVLVSPSHISCEQSFVSRRCARDYLASDQLMENP